MNNNTFLSDKNRKQRLACILEYRYFGEERFFRKMDERMESFNNFLQQKAKERFKEFYFMTKNQQNTILKHKEK